MAKSTRLQPISIIRTHIAHLGFLVLGQAKIGRGSITLFVLRPDGQEVEDG